MLGWTLSLRSYTKEIESIKYFRKQCFGFSSNLGIVFFRNLLAALRFALYVNHSVIKGITKITHASQTKIIFRVPLSSLKKSFLIASWVNYYFLNGHSQKRSLSKRDKAKTFSSENEFFIPLFTTLINSPNLSTFFLFWGAPAFSQSQYFSSRSRPMKHCNVIHFRWRVQSFFKGAVWLFFGENDVDLGRK